MDVVMKQASGRADFLSDAQLSKKATQLTKLPPLFVKEAQKVASELATLALDGEMNSGKEYRTDISRPQLTAPKGREHDETIGTISSGSRFVMALAEMMAGFASADLSKLAINSHVQAGQNDSRHSASIDLAAKYEVALLAVEKANIDLANLNGQLGGLLSDIQAIKNQLAEAERVLAAAAEGTPEYDAALQSRDTLQVTLATKHAQLTEKKGAITSLKTSIMGLQEKVDSLFTQAEKDGVGLPISLVKKEVSNITRMLMLMTAVAEMMMESGEVRTESDRALLKIQEDIRLQKIASEAEKMAKDIAKAEALNKTMGCVGKILGAVVTAVAVIGAVFTGGASLALAGIGIALMVADKVYAAATGTSFMDEAMKPLMKVLQPVLQFLMDKVSSILEGLGVDQQTAKMASMIVVSVAIAVAVVALAVTGAGGAIASGVSSVVSKIGSVMSRVMEKTIAKLIPAILKKAMAQASKQLSAATTRGFNAVTERLGLSTDAASKQIYASRMVQVSTGVNLTKTVVTGGLDVATEVANLNAAKALAKIKFAGKEMDVIRDMLFALIGVFQNTFNVSQEFFNKASDAINQHTRTSLVVTRAMSSASVV